MKKPYLVIGLYMCICYRMVPQYPYVPVIDLPISASITPQIRIGTPVMPSVSANSWKYISGIRPSSYRARTSYDIIQENNREIQESGYENQPLQVYQKWLDHVEELKKNEAEHPQSSLRKNNRIN